MKPLFQEKKAKGKLFALIALLVIGLAALTWYWYYPKEPSVRRFSGTVSFSAPNKARPPEAKVVVPQQVHPSVVPPRKKEMRRPVPKPARPAATGRWQHWGAAPYARSLAEACKKAPAAIDGFRMPQAVKEHFERALGDCTGGAVVWLTPEEPLEQMWSGGRHPHLMNRIAVARLPILRSPDGRPYRKGAVAETAKALSWTFAYEGRTYVLYLPLVCFNWSWQSGPAAVPALPQEKCVELSFDAPVGGNVRWGVGSTEGPLPPSVCNAQRQGSLAWTAWLGDCDICNPDLGYIRGILGNTAEIPHKYLYPVLARRQTLRFSTAIWSRVVYICIEYPDGTQTCGVYMRPQDWRDRYHVDIPDSFWITDSGNCPSAAH